MKNVLFSFRQYFLACRCENLSYEKKTSRLVCDLKRHYHEDSVFVPRCVIGFGRFKGT